MTLPRVCPRRMAPLRAHGMPEDDSPAKRRRPEDHTVKALRNSGNSRLVHVNQAPGPADKRRTGTFVRCPVNGEASTMID